MDLINNLTHLIDSLSSLGKALLGLIGVVATIAGVLGVKWRLRRNKSAVLSQARASSKKQKRQTRRPPSRSSRAKSSSSQMEQRQEVQNNPTFNPTFSPVFSPTIVIPPSVPTDKPEPRIEDHNVASPQISGLETSQTASILSNRSVQPPADSLLEPARSVSPIGQIVSLKNPLPDTSQYSSPQLMHDRPHMAPPASMHQEPPLDLSPVANESGNDSHQTQTLALDDEEGGLEAQPVVKPVADSARIEPKPEVTYREYESVVSTADLPTTASDMLKLSPESGVPLRFEWPMPVTHFPTSDQPIPEQVISQAVSSLAGPDHHVAGQDTAVPPLSNLLPAAETSPLPTTAAPESASPSGKLYISPHVRTQRTNLRRALYYASFIVQDARTSLTNYRRSSDSSKPFQNTIRIHGVIYDYLRGLREVRGMRGKGLYDATRRLNAAMNKLDIEWEGGDPRNILFAYPDPFIQENSRLSPEQLQRAFNDTMRNMVHTVELLGYTVREDLWDDPKYPHRTRVYMLARTRNSLLEASEIPEDDFEEEEELEDDDLGQ